jgi:hypothetical protein
MPGIGEVIEGAMQHAPQPERQSTREKYLPEAKTPPANRQKRKNATAPERPRAQLFFFEMES